MFVGHPPLLTTPGNAETVFLIGVLQLAAF